MESKDGNLNAVVAVAMLLIAVLAYPQPPPGTDLSDPSRVDQVHTASSWFLTTPPGVNAGNQLVQSAINTGTLSPGAPNEADSGPPPSERDPPPIPVHTPGEQEVARSFDEMQKRHADAPAAAATTPAQDELYDVWRKAKIEAAWRRLGTSLSTAMQPAGAVAAGSIHAGDEASWGGKRWRWTGTRWTPEGLALPLSQPSILRRAPEPSAAAPAPIRRAGGGAPHPKDGDAREFQGKVYVWREGAWRDG